MLSASRGRGVSPDSALGEQGALGQPCQEHSKCRCSGARPGDPTPSSGAQMRSLSLRMSPPQPTPNVSLLPEIPDMPSP